MDKNIKETIQLSIKETYKCGYLNGLNQAIKLLEKMKEDVEKWAVSPSQ